MSYAKISSGESIESLNTIFEVSSKLSATNSSLEQEWNAIECTLYNEEDDNYAKLKPNVIHECHLWKETFPYLRVKGTKIDSDVNMKKCKLRNHIIATVVNHLVMKIAGEGLNISADSGVHRPAAPKKESYFERGKLKKQETSTANSDFPKQAIVDSPRLPIISDSTTEPSTKPQPRSILKKSARKDYSKIGEKGLNRRTHLLNAKRPALPKINTRSNVWLNRSELHNASYPLPSKKFHENKLCKQGIDKERLILPPISPHIELKWAKIFRILRRHTRI